MTENSALFDAASVPTRSNVIDFFPRRFRLIAAGGMVQSFRQLAAIWDVG